MIIRADARYLPLKDACVDACVTSPPYFCLRDYRVDGQIGIERTPAEYIAQIVLVFAEVSRVLKPEGTLWLNIGDSYAASGRGGGGGSFQNNALGREMSEVNGFRMPPPGFKHKDLIGIPWMVAFALRADGWYLRSDIIWSKPNPMPESVTDRPTKAHEYLFLLTKSERYWYDAAAIREPYSASTLTQFDKPYTGEGTKDYAAVGVQNPSDIKRRITDKQRGHGRRHAGFNDRWDAMPKDVQQQSGANKRSVWTVATMPYAGAHFATMPEKLVEPCILAGAPEFVCSDCGRALVRSEYDEACAKSDSIQADVRRVWAVLREPESSVLQPQLLNETSGQTEAASGEAVQGMRSDVQPSRSGGLVLPEVQREMADKSGAPSETAVDRKTPDELEGREDPCGRIHQDLRPSDAQVSARASDGDGNDSQPSALEQGVCPPQERHQDGQQAREPRADGNQSSPRPDCVPSLRSVVHDPVSPCCGARIRPGLVLDPFCGSGTVLAVASRLGRRAVGTDLSYQELAKKRTAQRGLMFAERA